MAYRLATSWRTTVEYWAIKEFGDLALSFWKRTGFCLELQELIVLKGWQERCRSISCKCCSRDLSFLLHVEAPNEFHMMLQVVDAWRYIQFQVSRLQKICCVLA